MACGRYGDGPDQTNEDDVFQRLMREADERAEEVRAAEAAEAVSTPDSQVRVYICRTLLNFKFSEPRSQLFMIVINRSSISHSTFTYDVYTLVGTKSVQPSQKQGNRSKVKLA